MITAINDVVVIERDSYKGAIIVNEKMAHGIIVSIGPGRWKANVRDLKPDGTVQEHWYPTSLRVGQRVCFSLDKGEEHIIEGKHLVVMREDDIAGVIEDDSPELPPSSKYFNIETIVLTTEQMVYEANMIYGEKYKIGDTIQQRNPKFVEEC